MIRRAFAFTTAQRYLALAVNFATLIVLSRILTPQEIGTAAVGTAVALVAIAAREFASANFLVQHKDLTTEDVRGGFTAMLLLTAVIAGGLAASAPWLASALGNPGLKPYLQVLSLTFLVELVAQVIMALLQRDMAFAKIAAAGAAGNLLGAMVTVLLAALGFSYMSFAWGWFATAVTSAVLAICFRPDLSTLRPSLRRWRPMLAFGSYNGVVVILWRAYEQLPYLVLGRFLSMSEAGFYNRALNLSQIPQKMVLGSVFTLMLPVMSSKVRAGESVKEPYLRGVAYISAVQWPALILLAVLTHPVVHVMLGGQWLDAVPIVRIMALAALFSLCSDLNSATLISSGGIRDTMWRTLIAVPVAGLVLCAAAGFGLNAMALSFFLTVPFHEFLMLQAVQRRVAFAWRELGGVLWQSAVVTGCSAIGPLALVAMMGFRFDLSVAMAALAAALSAAGWMGGLWLTSHPLLAELQHVARVIGHNSRSV